MSKSVNSVMLLGNVGQPPEIKTPANGALRATVSIATNEKTKKGDKWIDHTEWHRVVLFGRLAELARDYLHKGSKVFIEGKLRTWKWDDAGTTRYMTNIIATDLTLLDSRDTRPPEPPAEVYDAAF